MCCGSFKRSLLPSQVNAAVAEVASIAELNSKLIAAMRPMSKEKLSGAERKKAAELVHAMAVS